MSDIKKLRQDFINSLDGMAIEEAQYLLAIETPEERGELLKICYEDIRSSASTFVAVCIHGLEGDSAEVEP